MRHFDLTPLYRSTIGFDRLGSLLDTLGTFEGDTPSYPPYNIERVGENEYRISMAVAGFGDKDLTIEVKENTLSIRGEKQAEVEQTHLSASRHRRPQLRAQVPACRPRRGEGREPREWPAARRPRARDARGDEAPHHPDRDQERQAQGHRQQGRVSASLTPSIAEGRLRKIEGALFSCRGGIAWPAGAYMTSGKLNPACAAIGNLSF